jgi:dihydrofolate synthase / folylpolyglutamate synthase
VSRRQDGVYGRALDALSARGPGRMVPDLARITELVGLLGDPQQAYRSVHVTGTNGKGSIVRITSALLDALGVRTGTYVSPHLQDVRERIMVGLAPIGRDAFAAVHAEVEALARLVDAATLERDGDDAQTVTFFELMTAMAFAHLADEAVDAAVIEVGMGGRWDATNVLDGDVAVIGEVAVDHAILGSTPEEIAVEKLGIVKPGAQVVSAVQRPGVAALVDEAVARVGGTLTLVGRDVVLLTREIVGAGQLVSVELRGRRIDDLLLPLRGEHQVRNLLAALGSLDAFMGASLAKASDEVLQAGLARVRVPGRLEVVNEQPTVVLDAAHNPHGARALAEAIGTAFRFRDIILVVGVLEDKDVEGILGELAAVASHVIVTVAPAERAAGLERMLEAAREVFTPRGVHVEAADGVVHALELATSICGPRDAVLVTGSLTTIGAARDHYLPLADDPVAEAGASPIRTLVVGLGDGEHDESDDEDGPDGRGEHDGSGTDGDEDLG